MAQERYGPLQNCYASEASESGKSAVPQRALNCGRACGGTDAESEESGCDGRIGGSEMRAKARMARIHAIQSRRRDLVWIFGCGSIQSRIVNDERYMIDGSPYAKRVWSKP